MFLIAIAQRGCKQLLLLQSTEQLRKQFTVIAGQLGDLVRQPGPIEIERDGIFNSVARMVFKMAPPLRRIPVIKQMIEVAMMNLIQTEVRHIPDVLEIG